MSTSTRSKVDLKSISISSLQHTSPCQQMKNETNYQGDADTKQDGEQLLVVSDDEEKGRNSEVIHKSQVNWEAIRNHEQKRLSSISNLTENEMIHIDQWLGYIREIYEELQYPILFRVYHTTKYFQEEEVKWYEQEKGAIQDDWFYFCQRLKQHISSRIKTSDGHVETNKSKSLMDEPIHFEQIIASKFIKYSGKGDPEKWLLQTIQQFKHNQWSSTDQFRAIPFLLEDLAYIWYIKNEQLFSSFETFGKLFLQRFSLDMTPVSNNHSVLMSQLSITMAREIIKTPSYFRGSKDDVMEWLENLEQRFKMANWDDENKLCYISIHLKDDAYRWWIQASEKITSWSSFVKEIKQAFGSTKMKELAFEQLRGYKQLINQSTMQYFDKIMELCKRIDPDMTDAMKLQYLMAGVKQSLKLHIALHDPRTSESFLSYARKLEDTLSLTKNDYERGSYDEHQSGTTSPQYSSTPGQVNEQNFNYKNKFRYPTTRTSQSEIRQIPFQQSSVVCYRCGTPGHYSRECTRPRFEKGK